MINPFKEINWQPGAKDLGKFAWSLIIGFPCIALFFFLAKWIKTHTLPEPRFFLMLGGIGVAVGLLSLLVPVLARPLYFVWYAATACIGLVMANLLFTVMFYGLFVPLGLLMRLLGRDPLKLRWQKEAATTYWQDADPPKPAAQYFSQY